MGTFVGDSPLVLRLHSPSAATASVQACGRGALGGTRICASLARGRRGTPAARCVSVAVDGFDTVCFGTTPSTAVGDAVARDFLALGASVKDVDVAAGCAGVCDSASGVPASVVLVPAPVTCAVPSVSGATGDEGPADASVDM